MLELVPLATLELEALPELTLLLVLLAALDAAFPLEELMLPELLVLLPEPAALLEVAPALELTAPVFAPEVAALDAVELTELADLAAVLVLALDVFVEVPLVLVGLELPPPPPQALSRLAQSSAEAVE